MDASTFIAKWQRVRLTERSASQQHFLDLCELVNHPKPAELDPKGEWFTFERGAAKRTGGRGWADVWKRGHFAFEYKGKHRDLDAAYDQLLLYRNSLENPPLLVACDMDRVVIHTNFTGTVEKVHSIRLEDFTRPEVIDILAWTFHEPKKLEPTVTREAITRKVAGQLADIAQGMRARGIHPFAVARFLNRLTFCMFAEDVGLLPADLFTRIMETSGHDPGRLAKLLAQLFDAMANGGFFGLDPIRYFNGNLFDSAAVVHPTAEEMERIKEAARLDWGQVDPSVFGTLFERGMDPGKRSQLGAHYTGRADIEAIVDPVVMQPLHAEWNEIRRAIELGSPGSGSIKRPKARGGRKRPNASAAGSPLGLIRDFLLRLQIVTVLDPACGSGNFLYVALQKLKGLEKEALVFAEDIGLGSFLPMVGPRQLLGIEKNHYAHDLAQMTVWIGYLQWQRTNGYRAFGEPILQRLDSIQCRDAILDIDDSGRPREPDWPEAEFVVGNPPFLGDKRMRRELGDTYVDAVRALYGDRISGQSDLCCYWFEKARSGLEHRKFSRVGLLGTQSIRGGASREVLSRIKQTGDIYYAWDDRDWIQDGANVHVSMVGFDRGDDTERTLNGHPVAVINANLTSATDTTCAVRLSRNRGVSFQGPVKVGPFEIPDDLALSFLVDPTPAGAPNSDVLRPWANGVSITQREAPSWIIDFRELPLVEASNYERPFEHIRRHVKPERDKTRRDKRRRLWWVHGEVNNSFRNAVAIHPRYLATCQTAKHRIYVWLDAVVLPAQTVIAFARSDDYFLGVLHSRAHEIWARSLGTQLRERESGFRYTPTTCFETFPFPEPSAGLEAAIGQAAKDLCTSRDRWLNPSEWTREEVVEFPGSIHGYWGRFVREPNDQGIGPVRWARLIPKDAGCAAKLADRTLTNLYNERPTWLDLAHRKLDEAVFAAYGWPVDQAEGDILARLLTLNLERAGQE